MSHNYHRGLCPSAAPTRGKVTVNIFELAAGVLHSNAKLQQIAISCSPGAAS